MQDSGVVRKANCPNLDAPEIIRVSRAAYARARAENADVLAARKASRDAMTAWMRVARERRIADEDRGIDRETAFKLAIIASHNWAVKQGYVEQDDPY